MGLFELIQRAPAVPKYAARKMLIAALPLAVLAAACYPPVLALEQNGRGGQEAAAPTPTPQIWTPTSAPTSTPAPYATSTPRPTPTPSDPFNFRANLYTPVTEANKGELGIQEIVDVYQTELTGRDSVGRFVGITFVTEETLRAHGSDPKTTTAHIIWRYNEHGMLTFAEIQILEGTPLYEAIPLLANESGKAYSHIDYGLRTDLLTREASALSFEAAALKVLERSGYRWHIMPKNIRAVDNYMLEQLQKMWASDRGWRDDIVLVNWLAAQDLEQWKTPQRTIEDYLARFEHINKRGFYSFMSRIKAGELKVDPRAALKIISSGHNPLLQYDEARRGVLQEGRTVFIP